MNIPDHIRPVVDSLIAEIERKHQDDCAGYMRQIRSLTAETERLRKELRHVRTDLANTRLRCAQVEARHGTVER